jgi:hypothetical protein
VGRVEKMSVRKMRLRSTSPVSLQPSFGFHVKEAESAQPRVPGDGGSQALLISQNFNPQAVGGEEDAGKGFAVGRDWDTEVEAQFH